MARVATAEQIRATFRWPQPEFGWPPAATLTFLALRDLCDAVSGHQTAADVATLTGLSVATTSRHLRTINATIGLRMRIVTGTQAQAYRLP